MLIYPPEVFSREFAPEKLQPGPNRKPDRLPLPSFFRGELLNFGGVIESPETTAKWWFLFTTCFVFTLKRCNSFQKRIFEMGSATTKIGKSFAVPLLKLKSSCISCFLEVNLEIKFHEHDISYQPNLDFGKVDHFGNNFLHQKATKKKNKVTFQKKSKDIEVL